MALNDDFEPITEDAIKLKVSDILTRKSMLATAARIDNVLDYQWVRESMKASNLTFSKDDDKYRFWTSADRKFTDSSLGGNYVINPRPQFTRYADIRSPGILAGRNRTEITSFMGNLGMGMYYSEAIDDPQQIIHVRCGVPEFNSLIGYFLNMYNHDAAQLARSGRWSSKIGEAVGAAAAFVIKVAFWKITAAVYLVTTAAQAMNFFMKKPASKFYYLKPTMVNYWSAVSVAVNQIATYKGMFNFNDDTDPDKDGTLPLGQNPRSELFRTMSNLMPDIYRGDGFFDIYAIANRTSRIRNYVEDKLNKAMKNGSISEFAQYTADQFAVGNARRLDVDSGWLGYGTLKDAIKGWKSSTAGKGGQGSAEEASKVEESRMEKHIRSKQEDPKKPVTESFPSSLLSHLKAEFMDGSQFASFRVDSTGPVDESFTSSVRESDISSKFNELSAKGRAASFTFAGGNIDGGAITAVLDGMKGVAAGLLSGLKLDGILGLAGGGFADIPKHWDNSSVNPARMNYTMKLVSPYGNAMSQFINLHIPMCMLLAMALPLSTGKQSYTSPFLIELYDQGRAQTRLGIVDSLTFVRGTTNLPFNKNKNFMSCDVSMSVIDLSSVMHMPIMNGFSLDPLNGLFDDDTMYSDYLNVLAGATLGQNIYPSNKFKLNAVNKLRSLQQLTSPAAWAGFIHELPGINLIDIVYKGTDRV